jgi:hypothetical protein
MGPQKEALDEDISTTERYPPDDLKKWLTEEDFKKRVQRWKNGNNEMKQRKPNVDRKEDTKKMPKKEQVAISRLRTGYTHGLKMEGVSNPRFRIKDWVKVHIFQRIATCGHFLEKTKILNISYFSAGATILKFLTASQKEANLLFLLFFSNYFQVQSATILYFFFFWHTLDSTLFLFARIGLFFILK